MKQFIYADNAATTQLDSEAFEAMKPYLLSEYGNASQPYSFSRTAKKASPTASVRLQKRFFLHPEVQRATTGPLRVVRSLMQRSD